MDISWHNRLAESWADRVSQGRVPHAVLLTGPVGVGKRAAAAWIAGEQLGIEPRTPLPQYPVERPLHADLNWIEPGDGKQGILRVYLKYDENQEHTILEIKRESKPSRRVYVKANEVKPVYNGMGTAILSTSRGVMTDRNARKENIGGEVLCSIW